MTKHKDHLSSTKMKILNLLGRYHYLTAEQLARLMQVKSKRRLYTVCQELIKAGYVKNDNFIALRSTGRPILFWSVTQKGRNVVNAESDVFTTRIGHDFRSSITLKHLMDLNDFLINFELLAKENPEIDLLDFQHDLELQRFPYRLLLPDGREVSFVPDGFVALALGDQVGAFCAELDRGTEQEKQWRDKIRCYVTFYLTGYEKAFGYKQMIVPIGIKSSQHKNDVRLAQLLRWTEKELTDLGKPSWGSVFRFTTQDAAETAPREFFGAPIWQQPFGSGKHPLLEGVL